MTSVSPDARRIWRAARAPVLIALVILFATVVAVFAKGGGQHGELDPASADPNGSRALATLLQQRGVRITTTRTVEETRRALAADPRSSLLVTDPGLVEPATLAEVRGRAAETVLVAPSAETLDLLLPGAVVTGQTDPGVRSPGCTVAAAVAAGDVMLGGTEYEARGRDRSCYGGSLLQAGTTTLLGANTPLTNSALDQQGDAALAMRLLGRHTTLVWYLPSPSDPGSGVPPRSLLDLLPKPWLFGAIQLAVAAVLFALWRLRRLGPVVSEPLPVVVRAAETVEGRARLYRRSGSPAYAAQALREATIARLLPVLGLGAGAEPAAVLNAVTARCGRDAAPLLYGPAPEDDASLVRLANELDRLTREVRES
ncbi:DUF4350 domain-containing protein [Amycolatopsis sp. K13G38]|uniref:DUF4350 domain-containing protein n=1 Tax=Amycolatopsis acididurans TaxID=2724524 RepID=A0ABX1JFQ4_9PSEU|nr:DUF4350 domain-containing protein [Amycolatopsis acididurans]NKQ57346.1 DUF4350 domain-containing protein [Amycolatopsis acididurans]